MQPLAIVVYQRLLPGSQLVNKLQDLHYRVLALSDPAELLDQALTAHPMLALVDLGAGGTECLSTIRQLRQHADTQHLPIIGFTADPDQQSREAAAESGLTILLGDTAILQHLPQCLQRALEVE